MADPASSPQDDPGSAGFETAGLERSRVSDWAAAEEVALRAARTTTADAGLVGVVTVDAGAVTTAAPDGKQHRCRAAAVKSVRPGGCVLRKSPFRNTDRYKSPSRARS